MSIKLATHEFTNGADWKIYKYVQKEDSSIIHKPASVRFLVSAEPIFKIPLYSFQEQIGDRKHVS